MFLSIRLRKGNLKATVSLNLARRRILRIESTARMGQSSKRHSNDIKNIPKPMINPETTDNEQKGKRGKRRPRVLCSEWGRTSVTLTMLGSLPPKHMLCSARARRGTPRQATPMCDGDKMRRRRGHSLVTPRREKRGGGYIHTSSTNKMMK